MGIIFAIAYFGFLFGYPPLQLWTLLRCRGWWRAFSLFCLIPAGPLYAWAITDFLHPPSEPSLLSLFFAVAGPVPVSYLAVVGIGFEMARRRRGRVPASEGDAKIDGPV